MPALVVALSVATAAGLVHAVRVRRRDAAGLCVFLIASLVLESLRWQLRPYPPAGVDGALFVVQCWAMPALLEWLWLKRWPMASVGAAGGSLGAMCVQTHGAPTLSWLPVVTLGYALLCAASWRLSSMRWVDVVALVLVVSEALGVAATLGSLDYGGQAVIWSRTMLFGVSGILTVAAWRNES